MLIPPERQSEEDEILARLRSGERVEHFETVRVAKDGRRIDVSLTVSPVRDATGTIIGASKIARDITALKQAEAERIRLLHENAAVTETLNNVGAIVASDLDRDKVVQAVTDAATELTTAEFGAFFYNVIGRAAASLHALHDLRRAARGVLEVPDAAQHAGVRADVQGNRRRPQRRHHHRIRATATIAPYHGMPRGTPAGAKLSGRAREGRDRATSIGGLFFGHSAGRSASPSITSGWPSASRRGRRWRSRMRGCTRASRRPAG